MNQALREFEDAYAFRKDGPYPGANDLYNYLKKHTPDSLQYFLDDSWKRVTVYDNVIKNVTINKTPGKEEYKVTVTVSIDKTCSGDKGGDMPAKELNDYIDIGFFGKNTKGADGLMKANPIEVRRYKFTRGEHTINLTLNAMPASIGIDPYAFLIDRTPGDNFYSAPGK